MSDKLLPCPFCGAEPLLTRFERGGTHFTQIQCGNDDSCAVCVDVQQTDEAVAVKVWNTRSVTVGLPEAQKTL